MNTAELGPKPNLNQFFFQVLGSDSIPNLPSKTPENNRNKSERTRRSGIRTESGPETYESFRARFQFQFWVCRNKIEKKCEGKKIKEAELGLGKENKIELGRNSKFSFYFGFRAAIKKKNSKG